MKLAARCSFMRTVYGIAAFFLVVAALWCMPQSALAVESDLVLQGISGAGVTGSVSSGYTVYVRDGDTATIDFQVKNSSGKQLNYVSVADQFTYEQNGETVEPIEFPHPYYGSITPPVTNAEYDSFQDQTSDTTGIKYRGFTIEAGVTATFQLNISAGDLAADTYDMFLQLGLERLDFQQVIENYNGYEYEQWALVNSEVEEVYSARIPITVVVYNQESASLKVQEQVGEGWSATFSPLESSGLDFGTVDLAGDENAFTAVRTISVYNDSTPVATDEHGITTDITVRFGGAATQSGGAPYGSTPFTWGNIYSGTSLYLYDTTWDPLPPSDLNGGGTSRASYSVVLNAYNYIAGTYSGNLIISTTPHNVKVNGQAGNASGVYRVPFTVTLTGENPNLLKRATGLAAEPGNGQVELTWTPGENSTEYTEYSIYRRVGAETQTDPDKLDWSLYEEIGTKVVGEPNDEGKVLYVDGDVENGTTYTYTVICGSPYRGYASAAASATPLASIQSRMLAPDSDAYGGVNYVSVSWSMNEKYGGRNSDGAGMVDYFNIYRDGVLVDRIYRSAVEDEVEYGWIDDGQGGSHQGIKSHNYSWSVNEPVPELYMPYKWSVSAVSPSGVESYQSYAMSAEAVGETPRLVSHRAWFEIDTEWLEDDTYRDIPTIKIRVDVQGNGDVVDSLTFWRKEGTGAPDTTAMPYATAKKDYTYGMSVYDYADTNVTAGKTYTYVVRGTDDEGNQTNDYTFTVKAVEDLDFGSVDVTWSVVNGGRTARLQWPGDYDYQHDMYVGTYKVYRNDEVIATLSNEYSFDYQDEPAGDGTYVYRVDKVMSGVTVRGYEFTFVRNTQPVEPETLLQVPDAPTLTARTSGTSNVILSWTPSTTGGVPEGYHIYRKDAGLPKLGGRYVSVYHWNGNTDDWQLWGNSRYMTIQNGSTLSFVDGYSGYYQDNKYLGRVEGLNWDDSGLPHEYYITAYNRAGESAPSQVVVFDTHDEDEWGNAIAPASPAEEAPTAPTISKAWVDWEDASTKSYFDPYIGGNIRVAWSDSDWGGDIDSWTLTYTGLSREDEGLNPPLTETVELYQTLVDPAVKTGTSGNAPGCTVSARSGSNGENNRTISITVKAQNSVGSATSQTAELFVASLPRFRALPDNSGALLEWTDLVDDTSTVVTGWEIWRKAEYGLWECRATLSGTQAYAGIEDNSYNHDLGYYAWHDDDAENGWTYQYKVVAKCADGVDRPSVVREVTPEHTAATEAPGAPQNLTAQVVNGEVIFTWDAPTTGGSPQYYYLGYIRQPDNEDAASLYGVGSVMAPSTSRVWTTREAGTYRFFVYTTSRIGDTVVPDNASPWDIDHDGWTSWNLEDYTVHIQDLYPSVSELIDVTITQDQIGEQAQERPDKPVVTATPGDGQVTLTWAACNNATYYTVERENNNYPDIPDQTIAVVSGQEAYTYTDIDALPGVKYRYIVTARNSYGGVYTDIYVKATGKTHDQIAAEQVEALIEALPAPADVAADDLEQIAGVQEVWESLTAKQKSLVNAELAQKLADCVEAAEQLRLLAQYADLVAPVQELIDALPTAKDVTAADAEQIQAARAAYEAISPAEAKKIVKTARLVEAENALATIADQEAAAAVAALIDALPSLDGVGPGDADAIAQARVAANAAREAYDALTGNQIGYLAEAYDLRLSMYEDRLLALEKQAAAQAAAQEVEAIIDALPAAESVQLTDRTAIEAARSAYDGLSDEAKALVGNYDDLVAAEAKLAALQREADEAAAAQVDGAIAGLPDLDSIELSSKAAIEEAREAYEALTADQKQYVTKLAVLEAAETRIADLEAIQEIVSLIDQIGDVSLESEGAIVAARTAYDQASAYAQENVANYALLEAAETQLQRLKDEAAAERVRALINALPAEGELSLGDREAIDAALAAYAQLTEAQKALIDQDLIASLKEADARVAQLEADAAEAARIDIAQGTVTLSPASFTYNGKARNPAVKLVVGGKTLVAGTDFTANYANNVKAGTGKVVLTGIGAYKGTKAATFKISKAANALKVTSKTASVKYAKVKKKAQTLKVGKVLKFTSKGQGTLTYAKKKGNKKIVINKKTGKVTVKKGLKKGTYKVTVAVKASGSANYKAKTVKATFKVKVG